MSTPLQEIVPRFAHDGVRQQQQSANKIQVSQVDVTQHRPKEVFQKCTGWQISTGEFKMTAKIGEGTYGMVYKCVARDEICAAKMLKQNVVDMKRTSSDPGQNQVVKQAFVWKTVDEYKTDVAYNDLVMELDVLVSVGQHPNLVSFKGACLADECNPIVFEEFVSGPSLKQYFQRAVDRNGMPLRPSRAITYYWIQHEDFAFVQSLDAVQECIVEMGTGPAMLLTHLSQDMLRGIEFLHNRDPVIIHRDLKPGNLMLTRDLCCLKIGDFGMSKMVPRGEMRTITHTGHCGTVAYMAPEMYNKAKTHYDEKVDIYSAAVIMWSIATAEGRQLNLRAHDVNWRPDLSRLINRARVVDRALDPGRPDVEGQVAWPQLEGLIQGAWDNNPAARPSASDMLAAFKRFDDRPMPLTPLDFKKPGCGSCCVQ